MKKLGRATAGQKFGFEFQISDDFANFMDTQKTSKGFNKAMAKALFIEVYEVGLEANANAPHDTGDMKKSFAMNGTPFDDGNPAPVAGNDPNMEYVLSYGVDYALPQHEGLHFNHPQGGEAKWLEKAVKAHEKGFGVRLEKWVQKYLKNYDD